MVTVTSTRSGERKRCDYQYHVAVYVYCCIYIYQSQTNDGFIASFAQAFYKAPGNLIHPKYRSGRGTSMIDAFDPKASESEVDIKKPLRDLDQI